MKHLAAACWCCCGNGHRVDTEAPLQTASSRAYPKLVEEVRLHGCQNQNLADSTRRCQECGRELRRMVEEGAMRADVKQFLLDRYGDFALYRPRLAPNTLLLWVGPGVIVVLALGAIALVIRRRMRMPIPEED